MSASTPPPVALTATSAPAPAPTATPVQVAAPAPAPAPAPAQVETPVVLPNLLTQMNRIRLDNILLTNGIGLGDALEILALAVGRSGVRFKDGQVVARGVNGSLRDLILEALRRVPRAIEVIPATIGFDPTRPMFLKTEAVSCPVNSEVVILTSSNQPPLLFPETDGENEARNSKG